MSHKKQPKAPCKHIQDLVDFCHDNSIAIYPTDDNAEYPENVRCYKCKRIFNIDTSGQDENVFTWEEVW
jgi:hypothetical protein